MSEIRGRAIAWLQEYGDILVAGLNALTTGFAAITSIPQDRVKAWTGFGSSVVVACVIGAKKVGEQRRAKDELVQAYLRHIVSVARSRPNGQNVRANIMMVGQDGKLRIEYDEGFLTEHAPERKVVWEEGQGCAGTALLERKIVTLTKPMGGRSFREFHKDLGNRIWGLTREQWHHTRHLGTIVSYPLMHGGQVIGVFNLDDTLGPSRSLLAQSEFLQQAETVREGLERTLTGVR